MFFSLLPNTNNPLARAYDWQISTRDQINSVTQTSHVVSRVTSPYSIHIHLRLLRLPHPVLGPRFKQRQQYTVKVEERLQTREDSDNREG